MKVKLTKQLSTMVTAVVDIDEDHPFYKDLQDHFDDGGPLDEWADLSHDNLTVDLMWILAEEVDQWEHNGEPACPLYMKVETVEG